MRDADGHIDAKELYRRASSAEESISLATVYRNLRLFRELGLVEERRLGQLGHYYEIRHPAEHQHFVCRDCGRVIEFQNPLIGELVGKVQHEQGFQVTRAEFYLEGRCRQCQDKREQARNRQDTRQILKRFGRKRGNLIPILQKVQARLGYLPREAMREIAAFLAIPDIDVYGVATFYNQFRLNPPGRHSIRVCLGTACHMKRGYITLDAWKRRLGINRGETTPDREFDLDTVACVGCCTMAPVTVVDDEPEGKVEPTKVDGILLAFDREREAERQKEER